MMGLALWAEGRLWRCNRCRQWFGPNNGASDNPPTDPCGCGWDHLEICDGCWVDLHDSEKP